MSMLHGPYHHKMGGGPRIADGGDNLQIWRVAANILNKQSRTADKGCKHVGKCYTRPWTWILEKDSAHGINWLVG